MAPYLGTPILAWPEGTPSQDMGVPHPQVLPCTDLAGGTPSLSTSPRKDMGPVEVLWDGDGVLPRKDMGPVEVLWDGDGVPPRKVMGPVEVLWDGDGVPPRVWTNKQTETITFDHPSDAGGSDVMV